MHVYLAGAIEYSPDCGRQWRRQANDLLARHGHTVYDPALDETKDLTAEERTAFRDWKQSDLPRFQQTIRKIIRYDLRKIEEECDAVLCYWDEHCGKGAGTQGELTWAFRLGKPVYLVSGMQVSAISGWILGCATRVFESLEEYEGFLQQESSAALSATP